MTQPLDEKMIAVSSYSKSEEEATLYGGYLYLVKDEDVYSAVQGLIEEMPEWRIINELGEATIKIDTAEMLIEKHFGASFMHSPLESKRDIADLSSAETPTDKGYGSPAHSVGEHSQQEISKPDQIGEGKVADQSQKVGLKKKTSGNAHEGCGKMFYYKEENGSAHNAMCGVKVLCPECSKEGGEGMKTEQQIKDKIQSMLNEFIESVQVESPQDRGKLAYSLPRLKEKIAMLKWVLQEEAPSSDTTKEMQG